MKKFILAALATTTIAAALPTVALADTACTVTVTKFHQSYPYSGRATVEYTVGGALPVGAFAEITINTDGASATFTQNNIVAGANTNVIDFASSFGGALVLTNASFVVTIAAEAGAGLGGVQLWEGGPYWAECNVGATKPEEYGWYFWWGGTAGYTNTGSGWVSVKNGTSISFSSSGTAASTYGKSISTLQSEGWIDASGNLAAALDAATAHLGAPWRMPTDAEFSALISNCTTTWIITNGVSGRLVTGKGVYANRSIFLPAAGGGSDSDLYDAGSYGYYWSSTPSSDYSNYAWSLYFGSGNFYRGYNGRYSGQSVRPVRGFAGCNVSGIVTYDVPIIIESVADWDALSAAVAGGLSTEGAIVLLANDVGPVTHMVGDSVHPFVGVFDGNGHTLTVAISGTGDCAAPFSVIDGATISNLVVTGTVAGGNHSAGLVGTCGATGQNVIRDCTVSVAVSGTGYLGGIVGHGGQGMLSFEGCVFSGAVSGFSAFAGGLMGWSNTMALNVTNCLSAGTFAPAGGGKYHPIACKRANQTVTATVADAYYLNTLVPTTMGGNLVPGAEGTPVSASLVAGEWAQPVTAADGNTYYAWTPAPAGRLLARFSFDDAGNGGLNLLHAAVGQDAIVRATQTVPVAGIGNITAVTDSSILSGLAVGDGAVAVTNGQYLAVPIPAPLLSGSGRPYTVVMKIRVPSSEGWRSLVNMPASNDTDAMIYLQRATRNIYLKQFNKESGGGVGAANGFVPAEQWATLTFAFGENATDVYLDGRAVLHADGALAGSYADCAAAGGYILVGADDNGDDELYYLSEFRIYEGAVDPSAWTESHVPDSYLDTCTGGENTVRVTGWAFDPDVPSQSVDVHAHLYTDSDCTAPYGDPYVLTANVPRPDVNQANGITGNHGFDAEIPVSDAGTYWVKLLAIDATGNSNQQIGATTSVTVTAPRPFTVTVTKFHQSYPHTGKATVEYTVDGTLPTNVVAEITLKTDDERATFVQSNVVAGANVHVIDFASSFGGVQLLTNASFVVTLTECIGGVQLWEDGPYWAECNVGATKPEEYGYYFWWGDTVGFKRENNAWVAADGSTSNFSFDSSNTPTYSKDKATLISEGWIDSTGNLVAAHDAATAYLGSPWRMPTDAEFAALISNCTTTWMTTNGVYGRLVTGKGDYANRSIFLPAAGDGSGGAVYYTDSAGRYWSSSTYSRISWYAWMLFFNSGDVRHFDYYRNAGQSVRPVRGLVRCDGIVTFDPVPVTKTTLIPVPHTWLDGYPALLAEHSGGYEAAANATAANGWKVWECYVAGLDPFDPLDGLRITRFWMEGDMPMFEFNHTTDGNGNSILPYIKPLGKANLTDGWRYVPDGGDPTFRFFTVKVEPPGNGVQLWKDGPYWAECNVGASKPEEYGYYFWWGDTVGFTNTGSGWVAVDGSISDFWLQDINTPTYGADNASLYSAGYIDSTANLVSAHDAAGAYRGSPWRMPTDAEFAALIDNCDSAWTTVNGVNGRLFTGRGDYADRSIFLPAAGCGYNRYLDSPGSYGSYWSSSASDAEDWEEAWSLFFNSSRFYRYSSLRSYGRSVRPVRDAD